MSPNRVKLLDNISKLESCSLINWSCFFISCARKLVCLLSVSRRCALVLKEEEEEEEEEEEVE